MASEGLLASRKGKRSNMKESITKETETVVSIAKKMTPDEMEKYLHQRFKEDMGVFKRLVTEQRKAHDWLRKQAAISPLLEKVEKFYADVVSDGYIQKYMSLFEHDKIKNWIGSQSRDEYVNIMHELENKENIQYAEIFRKWNRAYAINYESTISKYLIEPAQKVSAKPILTKAKVLDVLKSYKQGKYSDLFRSLIPHVRNSIQHQHFVIDPKQPKITFYDRRETPMSFTIQEYAKIFYESFFLTQSFDVAYFDLQKDIVDMLLDSISVVDDFLKKQGLKLSPREEGGLSILDYALLIKTGKIG
jgi:hypothetical protein